MCPYALGGFSVGGKELWIKRVTARQCRKQLLICVRMDSSQCKTARQLNEPVVYYSCSMWGGDIDHEYCLLYEPQESLLLTNASERGHGAERALVQGLQKLGLALPTPFFAPHTRSFDWAARKLVTI